MSKKIKVLSIVAIVLVVALSLGACSFLNNSSSQDLNDLEDASFSTSGNITVLDTLLNQPETVSFNIVAEDGVNANNLKEYVTVVDNANNAIDYQIEDYGDGKFKIRAPESGYIAGMSYTISLKDGVKFNSTDDAVANSMSRDFIIAKNEVENIVYKDNVVELDAGTFVKDGNTIAINNSDIAVGTILLAPIDNKTEAYKVDAVNYNGAGVVLTVSEAIAAEDIFEKIDVNKKYSIADGDLQFDEDALLAQLAQGDLSMALTDIFQVKPSISLPRKDIDLKAGLAYIDILFTLSFNEYSSLTILLKNVIDIKPHVNYTTMPVSFDLGAEMTVTTETEFALNVGYEDTLKYDAVSITNKLAELNKQQIAETNLKIFKWIQPIGPLLLSYDLDLRLVIDFAGKLGVVTTNTVSYDIGAYYADGDFKAYANKLSSTGLQLERIGLYGELEVRAGIVNTLSLEIFQIAKVGLELDTGAYLDLYGAIIFNVEDIKQSQGGYYLDIGLYYNVKVIVAAGILSFKFNKDFPIAGGKLSLWDFGNKVMNVDYTDNVTEIVLTSKQTVMPTFTLKQYNLVTKQASVIDVPFEDTEFVLSSDAYYTLYNGILTLKDTAPDEFTQTMLLKLKSDDGIETTVNIKKVRSMPYAENAILNFDKATPAPKTFKINLLDASYVSTTAYGLTVKDVSFINGNLTISVDYLIRLANGLNKIVVNTSKNSIDLWVNITGTVGLYSAGTGTSVNPFQIFTQEQVIALSNNAALDSYYNGIYFKITDNIDMRGATLNPISSFNGIIDGNGFKIYNFNIVNQVNGSAGLFASNSGTIKNLTVDGNVTINDRVVKAGAIAGINYGSIINCNAYGTVTVTYKTSATSHSNYNVGGIVGVNNGTITNVVAFNQVTAKNSGTSFSSVAYVAGVVGYNNKTNGASLTSAVAHNSPVTGFTWGTDKFINDITNNK